MKSTFLNAINQCNEEHIPVWFMRQAGRYLPEYMELKDKHSFKTRTHTPDLMTEISLQPLRRYPLDAAIMFSDILTPLEFMGAEFDFSSGGPKLQNAGESTLRNIQPLNTDDMAFVYEGIGKIKEQIGEKPLIGFVGAPFTLASYIVEGGTSKEFSKVKHFLFSNEKEFSKAMQTLASSVGHYLKAQMQAGVDAVQIFDSWVGFLNQDMYEKHILPHMQELIGIAREGGKPIILYSQPSSHLLTSFAKLQTDAISIDWRVRLDEVAETLDKVGYKGSFQGNLDPVATTLNWEDAKF